MRTVLRSLMGVAIALGTAITVAAAGGHTVELGVESSGVSLAGTLHVPAGKGPFPAIVFLHGSEPGRRSSPAYTRLTRKFQNQGTAVLVFDKRGVGDSDGTYVEAPDLQVPAGDALAWVDLLRGRVEIRGNRIGLLGWSQGGWVGPLAASRSPEVAFVISISGPGVSPLEQNIHDKTNQFRATGAAMEQVDEFARVIRLVWTYLVTGEGQEEAQDAWDGVADQGWFGSGYNGPPMMDRETLLADPRMIHYVAHSSYDPVVALERVQVPMLAVFGGDDTVVPVERSVRAMRAAASKAGNRLTVKIFPGADHGLRAPSGSGRRLAPGFEALLLHWVDEVVASEGAARSDS